MAQTRNKFLWRNALKYFERSFDAAFEERLKREITKTELLRVNVLIGVIVTSFAAGLLNFYLAGADNVARILENDLDLLGFLFVGIVGYEVLIAAFLWRQIRNHQPVSPRLRLINIIIETSFPTIMALVLFLRIDDVMILFTPILMVYFLFIILSTLHLNFWMSVATGLVSVLEYFFLSLYIVDQLPASQLSPALSSHVLLVGRSVLLLLSGFAAGFVAIEIRKRINDTFLMMNERSRIRQVLGEQVSHAVVDRIINEGVLMQHERRMVCVMFLDIRDFTPFASDKEPEEVMAYQNKLFSIAIEAVTKYGGIINQFLGDGFMSTFGAPISSGNDCKNAVDAALEILDETTKACDAGLMPSTRLGIGIHYGQAITGNVGTEMRKQYSIVGNVVIQASRIEQLNKEYKSQLLVSKEVFEKLENQSGELLGAIELKGENAPLDIYRIR